MSERAACCLTSDVGDLLLDLLTGDDGRAVELPDDGPDNGRDDGRDGGRGEAGLDACPAMHSVFGLVRPIFSHETPFFARKKFKLTVLPDILR